MNSIINSELIKIKLPTGQNVSFNIREKHINTEIQKYIDSYNSRGYMVVEKSVVNKTSTHATVKFVTQKIII